MGNYEGNAVSQLVNDGINRYDLNDGSLDVLLTFAVCQPESGVDLQQDCFQL